MLPDFSLVKGWKIVLCVPAGKAESLSVMKQYARCAILLIATFALAGCQTNDQAHRLGSADIAKSGTGTAWKGNLGGGFGSDDGYYSEPARPNWLMSRIKKQSPISRMNAIRKTARRLAPRGVNVSRLSGMVGKRRRAKIGCIPPDLRMLLNTVAWHYGKKVHIQSGYRSKHYNRRVGGARRSFHVSCKAVDIQVSGVNKYNLAKFLKTLPGRGGIGTYCNSSTVHIDVGPERSWYYGCGRKSLARRRLARYKKSRRRHKSYK